MSIDAKRRYAAAAFITLLILAIFWPSPIVSSNRLCCNEPLAVDELSFLGREAPSWDVVFWFIAGMLALAIVQSGEPMRPRMNLAKPALKPARALIAVAVAAIAVAITWIYADAPMMAWSVAIHSEAVESLIRLTNRLSGGMNPPMIVIFFLLAGIAYRHARWVSYALAMAMAGLGAGAIAHLLKFVVGRTRPELWLGPHHYAGGGAVSFPSGHTVGAFALAGVLIIASRSWPMRIIACLLAIGVGLSRVLAFRHWPSDVVASALIGLLAASVAAASVTPVTRENERGTYDAIQQD